MARYTITNLRELVEEANGKYPRETPNGRGTYTRFGVESAYGGYLVFEYSEKGSGIRECTHGHVSARKCAEKFREYLWENF